MMFATQSLLYALGIGATKSVAASAAVNWMLKEGLGKLARMGVATSYASNFDSDLKVRSIPCHMRTSDHEPPPPCGHHHLPHASTRTSSQPARPLPQLSPRRLASHTSQITPASTHAWSGAFAPTSAGSGGLVKRALPSVQPQAAQTDAAPPCRGSASLAR